MVIGAFGETAFEVSNFKVLTFNNFKRETKAKFASHETIGQPAKLEFLYSELEEISFILTFHKGLGVNPEEEIKKLREMCKIGEADFLIIGDAPYGDNEWVIESISESADVWDGEGKIYSSKVDVKLKEYIREAD